MIVVYGGVQVDAPHSPQPRFPDTTVDRVTEEVRKRLTQPKPRLVVGSAASGADLVVLEAARREGIDAHVILPFAPLRFVETSVASRGEKWVARFKELVRADAVEVLDENEDDDVYHRTNVALLERAAALADPDEEIVVLVVRPPQDGAASVSDHLADAASASGYEVTDIDPRPS